MLQGRSTAAAMAVAILALLSGCQMANVVPASAGFGGVDDGTTISMWTRSLMTGFSERLIDEYNATHRNKVRLTVMPDDSYQQRVGAAAGARQLPDLLATDVLYAPNYAAKGVFLDISANVAALPFRASLAPSHMRAASVGGRNFGVPFDIDVAALFYNKSLFIAAGLDGDTPPADLATLRAYAERITNLGGGVRGFGFAGACPYCLLVSTWPMLWASGVPTMNEIGTVSTLDSPEAAGVYEFYRKMYADGLVPAAAKNESGPTWVRDFNNGKVGMQIMGATALQGMRNSTKTQVGVAPIPGLTGGASSFVGGDVLGIGANTKHAAQAWDFINWTLSEEAQVNVVALTKNVPVRRDLQNNVFAEADPRVVTFTGLAKLGQTPYAVNFGKTFNDPNSPWMFAMTDALFGRRDTAASLRQHNAEITRSLAVD